MPRRPRDDDTEAAAQDPVAPAPGEWSREVVLRDGSPVLLRPIRPDDRHRLAEGVRRLSPASRYLRFHAAVDELTEEQLRYLTEVDHRDHEAIVAIDLDHPERPGVGVARYIREPYERHAAEAAITVADEYQGRGAGTLLLGALAVRARDNDVEVFRSYVLEGNHAMLEVFDHLGAKRSRDAGGLWRVDLEVPADEAAVPTSAAGRAFLELARDRHRLASLFPPIWSRLKRGIADIPGTQIGSPSPPDEPSPDDGFDLMRDPADTAELYELRRAVDHWLQDPDRRDG